MPPEGYGLYVYILPERHVAASIVRALEAFHECLDAPVAGEAPKTIALMLLPVRSTRSPRTDLAFSHDLLRTVVENEEIDEREIYIAATNTPLVRGNKAEPGAVKVILIGRVAPNLISTWLTKLQYLIEQGNIDFPPALVMKAKSFLFLVSNVGGLIGISPAEAAPYKCP